MKVIPYETVAESLDRDISSYEEAFTKARKEQSVAAPSIYLQLSTLKAVRDWLRAQKTIDCDNQRYGEWIYYDIPRGKNEPQAFYALTGRKGHVVCSLCGASPGMDSDHYFLLSAYCPHCGAVM